MTQLIRELAVEKVQAICELLIFKNDEPEQRATFMLAPSWIWRTAPPKPGDDFWDTEYIEASIPSENGYTYSAQWLKMFGVRFWPGGLPGGMPLDDEPNGGEATLQRKPLGEAERRRFCELYLSLWGEAATEAKALQAAKAAYPDSLVSRDPFNATFRDIRGPTKRGKKPLRD